MIKICDETIAVPLKIIFDTALKSGYPVPVHKKESKNIKKNYRPISLLPACGNFFEKCTFILISNLIIYYSNLSQVFAKSLY